MIPVIPDGALQNVDDEGILLVTAAAERAVPILVQIVMIVRAHVVILEKEVRETKTIWLKQ